MTIPITDNWHNFWKLFEKQIGVWQPQFEYFNSLMFQVHVFMGEKFFKLSLPSDFFSLYCEFEFFFWV
jgi:hypothetical protein